MPRHVTAGTLNKLVAYIQWINNTVINGNTFYDSDYKELPAYNESGAIFFNSEATGNNDGTDWANGYTDIATAFEALRVAGPGTMLTCRGHIDLGAGVGVSNANWTHDPDNWYIFRADPVQGCTIGASTIDGFVMGGQAYMHIHGFVQTSGGRIFSYNPGGDGALGSGFNVHHIVFSNIDGNMTLGGDNVGTIFMDTAGADYIGAVNTVIVGPGINDPLGGGTAAYDNTCCIYLSRVPHWRIMNCELSNVPKGFYYKHFSAADYAGLGHQIFANNWVHDCTEVRAAASGVLFHNNIFNVKFNVMDDGGGDNGADFNTITHNTFTAGVELAKLDNLAQGNTFKDNIVKGQMLIIPYQSITASTNILDSNLYIDDNIQYQDLTLTLAQWQASSEPAGQDANSITGTPNYVGGASPTTIAGHQLTSGPGFGAASDATDMGADVSIVGVLA